MLNLHLLRAESRKVWIWYLPLLGAILADTVLRAEPLGLFSPILTGLAALLGLLLAWRVFSDPANTQSFLWSRPMTRAQLFLHRWCLGLFFQVFTLAAIALALSCGARTVVQLRLFGNPCYPGCRFYDLNVLWPCGLYMLFVYHVAMYLRLYADWAWGRSDSYRGGVLRGAVIAGFSLGTPGLFWKWMNLPPSIFPPWPCWGQLAGVAVLAAIIAVASIHIYHYLEVES